MALSFLAASIRALPLKRGTILFAKRFFTFPGLLSEVDLVILGHLRFRLWAIN